MGITVGLHKILSLLESDDATVRIHAVKVVANLAAEGNLFSTQTSQVQKAKSCDGIFSRLPLYLTYWKKEVYRSFFVSLYKFSKLLQLLGC